MSRFASIDVGTNSVLLLVAEKGADGRFQPVQERAEITRLGEGVDQSKKLLVEAIARTVDVIAKFADEARKLGAKEIVISATSAARDASNGKDFLAAVKQKAKVEVQILSGDDEARLSFASAFSDFGGKGPLIVVDIGGGSTEFIYGSAEGKISFRKSFQIGSVRLTERMVHGDPIPAHDLQEILEHIGNSFGELPDAPKNATLVAVAGTATTVLTVAREIDPYDAKKVHGQRMTLDEVLATAQKLVRARQEKRLTMKGLQPKRADVIPVGALILAEAMAAVTAKDVVISDRGLRWGLLADRFGAKK